MIKRINRIKNFGVFQDYRRSGNIRDFEEKNIIYGWNYSGKTTLSRLISYLDKDTIIEDDYSNLEFEVELCDGTIINNNNRALSPLHVRVFNSDFVRENLYIGSEEMLSGIKFAVGDTGEKLKQIASLEDYKRKAISIIERNKLNISLFDSFDSKFTSLARDLSNEYNLGRQFNKANVKGIIDNWSGTDWEIFIISDSEELKKESTNAIAPLSGKTIDLNDAPQTAFSTLCDKARRVLNKQPSPTSDIELLSSDRDLFDWVKDGVDLYNMKYPQPRVCAFCGADISNGNRLAELNAYYTNEASLVKEDINRLKEEINIEKAKFNDLEWSKMSENDLTPSLHSRYLEAKQSYSSINIAYQALLDSLSHKLDDKYANSLFTPMELGELDNSIDANMQDWISSVRDIIMESNSTINNFSSIQTEAKNKCIMHRIATFLKNNDYRNIEFKKDIEEHWANVLYDTISRKEEEINRLKSQLESVEQGKEELKDFIRLFLNRNDIDITVTEDKYFVLNRGDRVAKHLSEGEKSAIAFSHFMVNMKSLKDQGKLKDYHIFIDDPISSLDENHIAQVCSIINSFFFEKGVDPANPEKTCNCFAQLFISTHNFELFSFLKGANNINRKRKPDTGNGAKDTTCNYFMIKRIGATNSTLTDIPKSLSKYKSEYVYLFSEIRRFKEENYPEDKVYLMPNVVRRFLEIYTLMKLPGNTDEIDNRIKILYKGRLNELKILHTYSHFTSFDRVTRHSELVLRMQDIIEDLEKILNEDPVHLHSLEEGIKE